MAPIVRGLAPPLGFRCCTLGYRPPAPESPSSRPADAKFFGYWALRRSNPLAFTFKDAKKRPISSDSGRPQ
ncbi:hypothetical protein C7U60_13875 [Mesorhizobium plurifarium]|nr:hypothetical protein C7U60_13875 [Mesorhizobium plurifarium]